MSQILEFIQSCNENLINGSGSDIDIARDYLRDERSLVENTWKVHQIGYCDSSISIPEQVRYFGTYDKTDKERWDLSRRIRGRLIVPIYSEFGKIEAFATRVPTTEPGNPWWNLPDPFKKGNILFLLDKARKEIFRTNKVYIVEGYIDALMLFQAGLKNVVAVMGTAYTLRKIGLTARYCNNVCLCFDSDENGSGTKAKMNAATILDKYSFCETITTIDELPLNDDPASFVSKHGIDKFLSMERVMGEEEIAKIRILVAKGLNNGLLNAK